MAVYRFAKAEDLEMAALGASHGREKFCEKEVLAAIIAVEDILNMEGFSLEEEIFEDGIERKHMFRLDDNEREYLGDIWNEKFRTLLEVVERLERYHEEKLQADYDEFAENGLEAPDPMVAKALILIENHTYIRDLLGSINADTREAIKNKYYGVEGSENIKRAEALFRFGPSDEYVGFDSLGRLDIDALGYLADRLIAAKIMDTQSAYEVIEYNGQLCEVYVDNGDINDFVSEVKSGTLLKCEGVCAFDSYRELIGAQKEMILDDFRDVGIYHDDGSWGFYLTEKELQHIGLGEALERAKAESENMKDFLIVGDNRFELVDELPLGHQFWNIGRNMPDGYLPMCRLKMAQPFDGAREIEPDTLKAIRLEGAQTVLRASIEGFETVEKMEAYVKVCSGKRLSEAQERKLNKVRDALEALKPLTMEKTLANVLEDAGYRAAALADKEEIRMMREFLKKHDPHFSTDEYLDGLSPEELKADYLEVRKCVEDSYKDAGDDWAQRRERLAAENLGFHG